MNREIKAAAALFDAKRAAKLKAAGDAPLLATRNGVDIPVTAPEWLWAGRFAVGEINLVEGDQMMGKTTCALELMARCSRGEPMPMDPAQRAPMGVMWFSPEEDTGKAGLPRFLAAGGDRARFVEVMRNPRSRAPQMVFPAGADLLDTTLTAQRQAGNPIGILGIDGLSTILERGKSENSNNDVKEALASLAEIARKHRITVIGMRHLGKNREGSPVHHGVGSIAFGAMARSQWVVVPHPDDANRKLLAPLKWSYASRTPRTLVFELASVDVAIDGTDEVRSFGVCRWLDECDVSAREAFAAANQLAKGKSNPKAVGEAVSAIEAAFADFERDAKPGVVVTMPENLLKDAIVTGYRIPASAYFEAKALLAKSKKFIGQRVGGEWHLGRFRQQWARAPERPVE